MSFLKRLFMKDKPAEKVRLNSSKLAEWFDNKTSSITDDAAHDLGSLFSELKKEIEQTKKLFHELENAKLMNEDITLKEKQFMEGNRIAYIKKVGDFLSKIAPHKMSVNDAYAYVESYKKEAGDFAKNSYRAFQITKNFFGDELDEITKGLKEIDAGMGKISALLNNEKFVAVKEIRAKISELNSLILKREELINSVEQEEKEYEDLKTARADYELKILKLKKHSAYIELQSMNEKLKNLEDELKILKSQFLDNFMQVDKALKKISKLGDEGLVAKYLEDPVSTLLSDSELKILEILKRTKEALEADQLEIEEKKKEKILSRISELTRDYLIGFVVKHNDIELKKSEMNRLIKQNSSMSDLNELHYKLDHVKDKQIKSSERIRKLNQQAEKLEIEETKNSIQESINNLGYDVEVEI